MKPNNEKREHNHKEHYCLFIMLESTSFRSTEKLEEVEDLIEAKST